MNVECNEKSYGTFRETGHIIFLSYRIQYHVHGKMCLTSVGFHSGKMINVVPYTLKTGFMLDVHFSPRVRVKRIWASFLIPLAAKV
jgi:hypothetical protein